MNKKQFYNKSAFSLVELSIVIIIMGLLVASITVGKDLIKAAQVRGLISQVQNTQTKINTFRLKYNALPGDIMNAARKGLGNNSGDGNSIIDSSDNSTKKADREVAYLWQHLNAAGLTNGAYDGGTSKGAIGKTFPEAKVGNGLLIYGDDSGVNYLHIGVTNSDGNIKFKNSLAADDAHSIDNKLDDGQPYKGKIVARSCANGKSLYADCVAKEVDNNCITTISGNKEYDYSEKAKNCQLRIELR
jgi:prepilin-type N-terminal cleavage/methylation domain-containing protein